MSKAARELKIEPKGPTARESAVARVRSAVCLVQIVLDLIGGARIKAHKVPRLAVELPTERRERGKSYGSGLTGFEDRQVGDRYADPVGEFGQGHPSLDEEAIKANANRHGLDRQLGFAAKARALTKHLSQDNDNQNRKPGRQAYPSHRMPMDLVV